MHPTHATELDGDEYLHLAMHASNRDDHHAALAYLKSALALDAAHPGALYLLAVEHAELGLYPRARDGLLRLLSMHPDMETARFQLGLLYLQLQDAVAARAQFERLSEDASDASLRLFAAGLSAMLQEKFATARDAITAGLATCSNAPLQKDMQRMLATLVEQPAAADVVAMPVATAARSSSATRGGIFLGAYRNLDAQHRAAGDAGNDDTGNADSNNPRR